jgi:CubicO group peptidase (beta-lactamase class C family)
MEAVTATRFDALMDSLIFEPMGLGCSYDVGALDGIENLAALYRNQGGWLAQADQFNGVSPGSPELADYTPGINGTRFAPQGGLRASAHELYELMCVQLFDGVALNGAVILEPSTVAAMRTTEWTYNGDNGNNYYNLFNSWGLGIQRITNTAMGDIVIPETTMWGHPGEAYGLISDWYFDPETKNGVIFLTNGVWNGYSFGNNSAFYTLEEDIFEAAEAAFSCTSGMHDPAMKPGPVTPNFGHPGDPIQANFNRPVHWVNLLGLTVATSTVQGMLQVPHIPAGSYFLQTAGETASRFTVL